MPNHEEQMERQLRHALERLTPDDAAKDRMYLEVMRRAALSQKKVKKRPWYLRWQTSAGICTAGLVCVVVAVASVHGRMPQNGAGQLQVVSPETVTTAEQSEFAVTTALPEQQLKNITAAVSTMRLDKTETCTQTIADAASESDVAFTADQGTESAAAIMTTVWDVQGELQQETVTAAVTTAPQTKAPKPQTTAPAETMAPGEETDVSGEKTEDTNSASDVTRPDVPIRQNIYLYYKLTWNDAHYDTCYTEITGKSLEQYLGYGVTRGTDVEDTYTVLIYSIVGVDPAQQLAVQYAGESSYYIFTVQ